MAFRSGSSRSSFKAGNAGLIASFVIAIAGVGLGAVAAFLGEFAATATAAPGLEPHTPHMAAGAAAPTPAALGEQSVRDEVVRNVIERFPLERLDQPPAPVEAPIRPKIVIILDDIGPDPKAAAAALALPGPITYSILPYSNDVEDLAYMAARRSGEVMLHLPMQPHGDADPGPFALRTDMSDAAFARALEWNFSRFGGYVGVNNHMGSKLTGNAEAMRKVLSHVGARNLYFVDSVTTGKTVSRRIGNNVGTSVLQRDVFIDPTPGDRAEIRRQLRLMEQIALETGYVVAIGHPRKETLAELGPWLATAEARGFELTTPSALLAQRNKPKLAVKPEMRL